MIFRFIIKKIVFLFYKLFFFVKVEGIENIPKVNSAVICSNHISNYDGPLIVATVSRMVYTMTKADAFKPVIGYFMKKFGCYPIRRDKKDFGTLKKSVDLLKDNKIVCVFPEGTRNGLAKGLKLRNGATFMILASKSPMIPVGISGNFKLFRRVTIRFGKPVYFDEFYGMENNKEIYEKVNEKILLNIEMQLTNNIKN